VRDVFKTLAGNDEVEHGGGKVQALGVVDQKAEV